MSTVQPLDTSFGAVITEISLDPLTDETIRVIRDSVQRHLVVVIKPEGGPQPDEVLLSVARSLAADLVEHERWGTVIPLIGQPDEDGQVGVGTPSTPLDWHTDYSYEQRPSKETLLHAVSLCSEGGATSFIDMYRAFETLPRDLAEVVENHDAVHTTGVYPGHPEHDQIGGNQVWHPMAFKHPDTGRTALYVNPLLTKEVVGLSAIESEEVLHALYDHAIDGAEVLEHRWEVGDLVIFDTIGSVHRREPYGGTGRRHLREISTIC